MTPSSWYPDHAMVSHFARAMFNVDRSSTQPLADQMVQQVIDMIARGVLRHGARMPSIRQCAKDLHISTFTVAEAYERLLALHHLESRPRAGYFVLVQGNPVVAVPANAYPERTYDYIWLASTQLMQNSHKLNVSTGNVPHVFDHARMLSRGLKRVAARIDQDTRWYGGVHGYEPLRGYVQSLLRDRGVRAAMDQIVLTASATQAYALVAGMLAEPGDSVLVDDPGYYHLMGHLEARRLKLLPVPRTPDGPDLDVLQTLVAKHKPKAYFTQSLVHNPTGSYLAPHVAYPLLQTAERAGFAIVEIDPEGDLVSGSVTRLAAMDHLSNVIYVGTFSKSVSPAVRVGFVACGAERAQRLVNHKLLTQITTSQINERLVYAVVTDSSFRRNLARQREWYLARGAEVAEQMQRLGLDVFAPPRGGKFLWVRHPAVDDSMDISRMAEPRDIVVAPGMVFRPFLAPTPWFRLNVAHGDHPRMLSLLRAVSRL